MSKINWDDIPKQHPIEWSTSAWNGPIITLDPGDPFGDIEQIFNRGIHVTHINPPEQGWPIATYCPICKKTTFVLSPWSIKPKDGDYWRMNEMCVDEVLGSTHGMSMYMLDNHIFNPYDAEFTQEMPIEEAKRRYPDAEIEGKDKK